MNVITLAVVLVVPLCSTTAAMSQVTYPVGQPVVPVPTAPMSQPAYPVGQMAVPVPTAGLSRDAVRADLQVWRESGLAAAQAGDSPDTLSDMYQAAEARYLSMRGVPAFADRVAP